MGEQSTPTSVVVVVAHPDDVDFGAAGTVATWVDAGTEVSYCIVTDGDAGGFDLDVPRGEIPGIRRAEQEAAAKVLGVSDVMFLGYPDGRVGPGLELRRDISRIIRQVQPQRVLCPSPERNFERIHASHPDHLAVGEATLCAVYPDARNAFAHPELLVEGLGPHSVREVWLAGSPSPDHFMDVTAMFERKVAALRCHVSQLVDEGAVAERVRAWMSATAELGGLPAGTLAEAFQVVVTA